MIKTIKLKFGRGFGSAPEEINTTPVTVFVGPNNSGKSKALAEINYYCSTGQRNTTDVILDSAVFDTFAPEVVEEKIRKVTLQPQLNEALLPDYILVGKKGTRNQVPRQQLVSILQNTNSQPQQFCQWYLAFNTLILDGRSRINLIGQQAAGDLQLPPQTSFQFLFRDDIRACLRTFATLEKRVRSS